MCSLRRKRDNVRRRQGGAVKKVISNLLVSFFVGGDAFQVTVHRISWRLVGIDLRATAGRVCDVVLQCSHFVS